MSRGKDTGIPALPDIPMGTSIPRIIHQVVMQGEDSLPDEIRTLIAGLRHRNPDWDYRFYDAAAVEAFIADAYGQAVLDLYLRIDPRYHAARADLFRYLVCFVEGGLYLDFKSTVAQPLSSVLRPDDVAILAQLPEMAGVSPEAAGTMSAAHPELAHIPGYEYVNWFILSVPGHPFLRSALNRAFERILHYDPFVDGVGRRAVLRTTGPVMYSLAVHPLRAESPHRLLRHYDEITLEFSVYQGHAGHRNVLGVHYSQLTCPLIRQGPVKTWATEAWYGRLQPRIHGIGRRIRRLTAKARRMRNGE